MVAAAQGAKAPFQTSGILQSAVAAQVLQVEALLPPFPDAETGGNEVGGGVHLWHVDLHPAQVHSIHAAADIHAHDVGYGLVLHGHGGADGAALAGVHVRHDADAAAFGEVIVAHPADLLNGLVLNDLGKADRGIYFSFDFHPIAYLLLENEKSRLPHTRQAAREST